MIRTLKSVDAEIETLQTKIKKLEQTKDNFEKLSKIYPDVQLCNSVFCSAKVNKDFEKVSIKSTNRIVIVSPYCIVEGIKIYSNPKKFELARKLYSYSYSYNNTNKSEIKVVDLEDLKKRYNINEEIFSHKKVKMALISFIKRNEGSKIINLKDNKLLSLLAAYL
jgi:hypothetical protein